MQNSQCHHPYRELKLLRVTGTDTASQVQSQIQRAKETWALGLESLPIEPEVPRGDDDSAN